MNQCGVVCIPVVVENSVSQATTTKNNNINYASVVMEFQFFCGELHTDPIRWVGEAMDSGDKTYSKAESFAIKTFLQDFFLIPRTNMDDVDGTANEGIVPHYSQKRTSKSAQSGSSPSIQTCMEIFHTGGLNWLQRGTEGHDLFAHFVRHCKISSTYIKNWSIPDISLAIAGIEEFAGETIEKYPVDSRIVEAFRAKYTKYYNEQLEQAGTWEALSSNGYKIGDND